METVPVVKHIIRNSASLTEEGHKQPQLKPQISLCFVWQCVLEKKFCFFFFLDYSDQLQLNLALTLRAIKQNKQNFAADC